MMKIFLVALVAQTTYSRVITRQDDIIPVGDMFLTPEQYNKMTSRKLISDTDYFWKKTAEGVIEIPYIIVDPKVDAAVVLKGQAHWEKNTCVKFTKLAAEIEGKSYFRYVNKEDDKCTAYVGMQQGKYTEINMGSGCGYTTALHEIGHAIGFQHEMARPDRDEYIILLKENINDLSAYDLENVNTYGIPYDYMSIMQYHDRAFGINDKLTMLTTDPRFQNHIGGYKDFSFMDLLMFNKAYKCIDDWLKICKLTEDPCQNMGFTGKDCKCVCPAGTSGNNCENSEMSYNDGLMKKISPHTKTYRTENSIVSSPNYPNPPINRMEYMQVIKAPKCKRAVLTFEAFKIYDCEYEHLKIRTGIRDLEGKKFCSEQITKGQVFKSANSTLILDFSGTDFTDFGYNPNPGYKAVATFEPIDGCTA